MKKIDLVFLVVIVSASLPKASYCQGDGQFQRNSLKGLDTLSVIVSVDDDIESYISAFRLKTVIELELRRNGFVVLNDINKVRAIVRYDIIAVPIEMYDTVVQYAMSHSFTVEQWTILVRDPLILSFSSTWSDIGVSVWGTKIIKQEAEDWAKESTESFINAVLSVK